MQKLLLVVCLSLAFLAAGCDTSQNTNTTSEQTNQTSSAVKNDSIANQVKTDSETTAKLSLYSVVKVVDGDTVNVNIDGKTETVRFIGINTPETVDSRKSVECFGTEASNKAKELLQSKQVSLEADASQGERDKYQRLLRYVFLEDGTNVNQKLIAEGFANEYTYSSSYKYQQQFKQVEKEAKEAKRGLWSDNACANPVPTITQNKPTITPSVPKNDPPVTSGECNIKGNISSSGEEIYHVPGGASYNATKIDTSAGERMFCSEQDALAAGWRKALR